MGVEVDMEMNACRSARTHFCSADVMVNLGVNRQRPRLLWLWAPVYQSNRRTLSEPNTPGRKAGEYVSAPLMKVFVLINALIHTFNLNILPTVFWTHVDLFYWGLFVKKMTTTVYKTVNAPIWLEQKVELK